MTLWNFRVWKWCFGYGLDYSIGPAMRVRIGWSDKKDKGILNKVNFSLVIQNGKKYLLLNKREFIGVTEKFNGKDWYEVLFEV